MLNIENLIYSENTETFIIDKGEYGNVEVRHYLPGALQDKLAEAVTQGLTVDGSYYPGRKNACMLLAFMMSFVVDGETMIVKDGDDIDLYETYRVLEEELGIMTAARKQSASVDAILTNIEKNVDLMVYRELEYRDALLSAGLSVQIEKCMMWVEQILMNISKTTSEIRMFSHEKSKELDGILTKKNVTELLGTLSKLETLLAGKQ